MIIFIHRRSKFSSSLLLRRHANIDSGVSMSSTQYFYWNTQMYNLMATSGKSVWWHLHLFLQYPWTSTLSKSIYLLTNKHHLHPSSNSCSSSKPGSMCSVFTVVFFLHQYQKMCGTGFCRPDSILFIEPTVSKQRNNSIYLIILKLVIQHATATNIYVCLQGKTLSQFSNKSLQARSCFYYGMLVTFLVLMTYAWLLLNSKTMKVNTADVPSKFITNCTSVYYLTWSHMLNTKGQSIFSI